MSQGQLARPPLQIGLLIVSGVMLLGSFVVLCMAYVAYRSTPLPAATADPPPSSPAVAASPAVAPRAVASPPTATGGRRLNMIELFGRAKVVRGVWSLDGQGHLTCATQHLVPRIQLPYIPPDEYNVRLVYKQPKLRNAVGIIFPCKPINNYSIWELPPRHAGRTHCRLYFQNFRERPVYKTMQPGVLYTVEVHFRRDRIRAFLDGVEILNHATDYRNPRHTGFFRMPDPQRLGISCDDPTEFHMIEVQEISGPGTVLSAP